MLPKMISMALSLSGLLAAPHLELVLRGAAPASEDPIQWVAVTELEDPAPFLGGGEVVLTTGLRHRTRSAQVRFVDSVFKAGALAIGFGTGLSHAKVPAPLLEQADALKLPVFEVPYQTPFVALGRMVAQAQAAEHVDHLEGLLRAHQTLAGALLSGRGLSGLLGELARLLDSSVTLHQYGAQVLAFSHDRRPAPAETDDGWHRLPVATGMRDRCTLAIAEPYRQPEIVAYAQSLISVELSNLARRRARDRAVTGQLLADVGDGRLAGREAALRLAAAGLGGEEPRALLLADVGQDKARQLSSLPLPAPFVDAVTAVVDSRLVVIVSARREPHQLAEELGDYLDGAGLPARIGVGGGFVDPAGLRWSYFAAREALTHGRRVNEADRLSLASLLMTARDVPLSALAEETLQPVLRFDEEHAAGLLETLQQYLDLNGSTAAVAEALSLHRNTVRYRLAQIRELTGYDPARTADRVHLFLALRVHSLSG